MTSTAYPLTKAVDRTESAKTALMTAYIFADNLKHHARVLDLLKQAYQDLSNALADVIQVRAALSSQDAPPAGEPKEA